MNIAKFTKIHRDLAERSLPKIRETDWNFAKQMRVSVKLLIVAEKILQIWAEVEMKTLKI